MQVYLCSRNFLIPVSTSFDDTAFVTPRSLGLSMPQRQMAWCVEMFPADHGQASVVLCRR
jgi:hypothetical protein